MAVPITTITGERVLLRPFRVEDAVDIAESCQDPEIPRFTMMPEAMSEAQAREWIERRLAQREQGIFAFAITLPPSDRCIGQMGVFLEPQFRRGEAFYWLDRRHRGQRITTEALNLIADWAFSEHGMARIHLVTHVDNPGSQRVAERCGFQREGVLRAWQKMKDDQPDVVMWSRLPGDRPAESGLDRS